MGRGQLVLTEHPRGLNAEQTLLAPNPDDTHPSTQVSLGRKKYQDQRKHQMGHHQPQLRHWKPKKKKKKTLKGVLPPKDTVLLQNGNSTSSIWKDRWDPIPFLIQTVLPHHLSECVKSA